jgi:hypothetical protein
MKLQLQFENYKKLRDLKADLDGNNIYLVQGGNERGKTTFINGLLTLLTAKNNTLQPVSIGKEDGKIILDAERNGEKFKVLFEFTNAKNKFTLVTDSRVTNKVTDIRAFFDYTNLTADEFLGWSNTAEGRRKQRDIVLKLLPESVRQEFERLTGLESIKYNERTLCSTKFEVAKLNYENAQSSLNPEMDAECNNLQVYQNKLTLLSEEREDHLKFTRKADTATSSCQHIQNAITNFNIDSFNVNNPELKAELTDKLPKIKNWIAKKQAQIDAMKSEDKWKSLINESERLQSLISKLLSYKNDKAKYEKIESKYKELAVELGKLNSDIAELRAAKAELIEEAGFPIPELDVGDDGLIIATAEGKFPFDTRQISTSLAMLVTSKILLLLNKHLPVIVVGRAESFDRDSLNNLHKFAVENECVMVLDRVIESNSDIEIVGYEKKEEGK